MTPSSAQHVIIGTMAGSIIISVIQDLTDHKDSRHPTIAIVIGGYVVTLTLLLVSGGAPDLAGLTSVAIFLSVLIGNSSKTLAVINRLVGGQKDLVVRADNRAL